MKNERKILNVKCKYLVTCTCFSLANEAVIKINRSNTYCAGSLRIVGCAAYWYFARKFRILFFRFLLFLLLIYFLSHNYALEKKSNKGNMLHVTSILWEYIQRKTSKEGFFLIVIREIICKNYFSFFRNLEIFRFPEISEIII